MKNKRKEHNQIVRFSILIWSLKIFIPFVLKKHYSDKLVRKEICKNTNKKFKELLLNVNYIGGKNNSFSEIYLWAVWCLAFYLSNTKIMTVSDAGNIVLQTLELQTKFLPKFLLRFIGHFQKSFLSLGLFQFNKKFKQKLYKEGKQSLKKQHFDNWVFGVVENNDEIGIDYYECAVCKLYNKYDANDLIPYICQTDFITNRAFGLNLRRTKTLCNGDDRCEFRWNKNK